MKIFVFRSVYGGYINSFCLFFWGKIKSNPEIWFKTQIYMWLKHFLGCSTFTSHKPLIWEDKKQTASSWIKKIVCM